MYLFFTSIKVLASTYLRLNIGRYDIVFASNFNDVSIPSVRCTISIAEAIYDTGQWSVTQRNTVTKHTVKSTYYDYATFVAIEAA